MDWQHVLCLIIVLCGVGASNGLECCKNGYTDFVQTKCISADLQAYNPLLSCERYIVFADSFDYHESSCNVNITDENGASAVRTVTCDTRAPPFHVTYLFPVSVMFLFMTAIFYATCYNLRSSLQDVATFIISLSLAIVMLIRIIYYFNLDSGTWHALDEYLGKFALIAYFSWLNVLLANVLIKLIAREYAQDNSNKTSWLIAAHCYGWCLPSLVIWANAVQLFGDYSFDYISQEWYYKYLPISFLWTINLCMFIIAIGACAFQPYLRQRWTFFEALQSLLLTVIWFTWIFEIVSLLHEDDDWTVTDIINSLQGVLIFFAMVIFRQQQLRADVWRPHMWSELIEENDVEDIERYNGYYGSNLYIVMSNEAKDYGH